jgi:glutamyl-tRNA(Gln) amidotransferase subunit D
MHGSMSDEFCYVHQGTKVRKLHTSRRDTFRSVNVLPLAKVLYKQRRIEYLRSDYRHRGKGRPRLDLRINPNVTILYSHPGMKPEFVRSLAEFWDGIVIAATGLGHVPTNPLGDKWTRSLLPALRELIESGIPVVIAPQTIWGRLNLNVYEAGRLLDQIGVIGNGCDWTPECALVKLMWVLGHTRSMKRIREMMLTNYAGELAERIDPRSFLYR